MTYSERWGHPRRKQARGNHQRKQRRIDAEKRQAVYNLLSTQEKIEQCLSRPGESTKELRRLGYGSTA